MVDVFESWGATMKVKRIKLLTIFCFILFSASLATAGRSSADDKSLSRELEAVLAQLGFTGRIEGKLEERLGRPE
jgi:hypothetical protein